MSSCTSLAINAPGEAGTGWLGWLSYGAEIEMIRLLDLLAGDCRLRDVRRPGAADCGAHFPDLGPDEPRRPKLKVGQ